MLFQRIRLLETTIETRERQVLEASQRYSSLLSESEDFKRFDKLNVIKVLKTDHHLFVWLGSLMENRQQQFEQELSRIEEEHRLEMNSISTKFASSQQRVKELEKQLKDFKSSKCVFAPF